MVALAVGLAGAFGSMVRHGIGSWVTPRTGPGWPYATMGINIVASFILALVVGGLAPRSGAGDLSVVLGSGLCGGLSTWSTVTWDVAALQRRFGPARAAAYLVAAPATS